VVGCETTTVTVVECTNVPLVPVTVIVYVPGVVVAVVLIVSVDVPEPPATLVGLRVAVTPVAGYTVSVSDTVPVKPLSDEIVTVDVAPDPAFTVKLFGLALMVKSGTTTITVTVAVRVSVLYVPVTITVYVPPGVVLATLIVRALEPVSTMKGGLAVAVIPAGAVTVSVTFPAKPLIPVWLIDENPVPPWDIVRLDGLADKLKSWTVKVTAALRDRLPFMPVTVTVNVPVVLKVHESVAVPDPVKLVGVTLHAVLFAESATMPLKPLTPVTVMVEVPAAPTTTVTLVGDAVSVKS